MTAVDKAGSLFLSSADINQGSAVLSSTFQALSFVITLERRRPDVCQLSQPTSVRAKRSTKF